MRYLRNSRLFFLTGILVLVGTAIQGSRVVYPRYLMLEALSELECKVIFRSGQSVDQPPDRVDSLRLKDNSLLLKHLVFDSVSFVDFTDARSITSDAEVLEFLKLASKAKCDVCLTKSFYTKYGLVNLQRTIHPAKVFFVDSDAIK